MAVAEPVQINGWVACDHPDPAVRLRTRANRTQVYVLQCLSCGREMKTLARGSPEVMRQAERIPFDEDLAQRRTEEQRTFYEKQRVLRERQWAQERAQAQAEAEKEKQAWWDRYNAYLKTPQWQRKRQAVFTRSGGLCEGCRINKAIQVHHLTYDHVCDEFLWELVAICRSCHVRLHPHMEDDL